MLNRSIMVGGVPHHVAEVLVLAPIACALLTVRFVSGREAWSTMELL